MADIVINAQNSPYNVPGGSVNYGSVEIQTGGYMQMEQQTKLTISSLTVSSGAGGSGPQANYSSGAPTAKKQK
jgi:hypothetical protein